MPAKHINMQPLRLIIQHLKNGFSQRTISKLTGVSRPTISTYKSRVELSGLTIDELLSKNDEELSALMLEPLQAKTTFDYRYLELVGKLDKFAKELNRVGVTKQLLWQEYRGDYPDGYGYSQFCYYLQEHAGKKDPVMHFEHTPGYSMQVDFAGNVFKCRKPNGEIITYQVFIAILPYSGYTYVEAVATQNQADFLKCMQNAVRYFGGVPSIVISDNLKSCVIKASRYEPEINQLMEQFSLHYDTAIMPARVRKPRDKPSVENGVNLAYQRIYAPLRDQYFNALELVNQAMLIQLDKHHERCFRKTDKSRSYLFENYERNTLKPLPTEAMLIKQTVNAKVQQNYHVVLGEDWHFYSVPHTYLAKQVEIVYTLYDVEIYCENKRIAVHRRNTKRNFYTTDPNHMPEHHQHYCQHKGWSPDNFRNRASRIGSDVLEVINKMLESRQFIEQTYRACQGILVLESKYGKDRLIKACQMALKAEYVSYKFLNSILQNKRDQESADEMEAPNLFTIHENIRGNDEII